MQKLSIFSVLILSIGHLAGKPQPTRVDVYKTASETELKVFIFEPDGHKTKDKRPCAVFFFGGGWTEVRQLNSIHIARTSPLETW